MSKTTIIDLEEEVAVKSNDLAGLLEDPTAMLDFVKPKQYELPQPMEVPEELSVDYFEVPYKEKKRRGRY